MNFQARQGDIFFEVVTDPKGKPKEIGPILAYGEVTGHAHRIVNPPMSELDSYVDEGGDIFIRNPKGTVEVGHEEHGTVMLPQNEWVSITRQREYDPAAALKERQVAD